VQHGPVSRAQRTGSILNQSDPTAPEHKGAVYHAFGNVKIVGRKNYHTSCTTNGTQSLGKLINRSIIEPCERFIKQHKTRFV
jgi:hypothetical protein